MTDTTAAQQQCALPTLNPSFGYHGVVARVAPTRAKLLWHLAFAWVERHSSLRAEEAREYLDSTYGRHAADAVIGVLEEDHQYSTDRVDAFAKAVEKGMYWHKRSFRGRDSWASLEERVRGWVRERARADRGRQ